MTGEVPGTTGSEAESEALVALTDLAVGLVALAMLASTRAAARAADAQEVDERRGAIARGFGSFFVSVAVASLVGAALHGLFRNPRSAARRLLWRISLGAIGISGVAGVDAAAAIALPAGPATVARRIAAAVAAAWLAILAVAVPPYPAVIALTVPSLGAFGLALRSRIRSAAERPAAVAGLAGLALTAAAAIVQLRGIGLTRRFGPNALYHTIQAVALLFLGRSARLFLRPGDQAGADRR